MVVKDGPRDYQIYDGTVTSCQLPNPDWLLSAAEFSMDDTTARARGSVFHLMSFPVLWLPYVTHPVNADNRESGFLIPEIGFNSASKGTTVGEQVYWAINRSTDLTAGAIYYSARGWEQTASLRYLGRGQDFIKARYSGLQDRGYTPSGGTYINQSGTDVLFSGRYDMADTSDSGANAAGANFPGPRGRRRGVSQFIPLSRGVLHQLQPGGIQRCGLDGVCSQRTGRHGRLAGRRSVPG